VGSRAAAQRRGRGARLAIEFACLKPCCEALGGARQRWLTHPLGQTLIVTASTGWIRQWGGRTEEVREGDVVWIPPGQKHWHGATATTSMTHIAIQEFLEGKNVDCMEKVSDEQYGR
jgi:hypothetical protein